MPNLEQIGLEGVFKTDAFTGGLSTYLGGLDLAKGATSLVAGVLGGVLTGAATLAIGSLVAVGAAAVAGGVALVGYLSNATMVAARLDQLNLANVVLAKNMGISYDVITQQEKAMSDLGVANDVASQTMAKMMEANLQVTAASKLATIAQNAGAIAGMSTSDALATLVQGVITQRVYTLRTMGIIVNATDAYEAYGKSIGVAAKDLTTAQKQQAFLNAVLAQGAHIAGAYAAAINNPVEQLANMKVQLSDISELAGEPFVKGLSSYLSGLGDLVGWVKKAVDEGGLLRPILDDLGVGFKWVGDNVKTIVDFFTSGDVIGGMGQISSFLTAITDNSGIALKKVSAFLDGILKKGSDFKKWFDMFLKFGRDWINTNLPTLVEIGSKMVDAIWTGLGWLLLQLIPFGADIVTTLVKALIANLPAIIEGAENLFGGVLQGIQNGANKLLAASGISGMSASDIVSWIFGKAADLSGKFLTWVQGIPWGDLSRDVAGAISGLPWGTIGFDVGEIGTNLWKAINLALFGGTVATPAAGSALGGGAPGERIVKGIDWGAIASSIGTAFVNAVVAGLTLDANATFQTKVLDVFSADSELLQSMLTQHGNLVGFATVDVTLGTHFVLPAGADTGETIFGPKGFNFLGSPADQVFFEGLGQKIMNWLMTGFTDPTTGQSIVSAALYTWEMQTLIPGLERIATTGAFGPVAQMWAEAMFDHTLYQASFDALTTWFKASWTWLADTIALIWWTEFINPIQEGWNAWLKLFGMSGQIPLTPAPNVPAPPATTSPATPSGTAFQPPAVSVPGTTPTTTTGKTATTGETKNVTNNVTINNPRAEPASISLTALYSKLNYLGYAV